MFLSLNHLRFIGWSVRVSPLRGSRNLIVEPPSAQIIFGFPKLVLLSAQPNVAFPLLIRQLPSYLTHAHEV